MQNPIKSVFALFTPKFLLALIFTRFVLITLTFLGKLHFLFLKLVIIRISMFLQFTKVFKTTNWQTSFILIVGIIIVKFFLIFQSFTSLVLFLLI